MRIFYPEGHRNHNPPFEIFDGGEKFPSFEVPERAERILAALQTTDWAEIAAVQDFGLAPIRAVHDTDYLEFLKKGFEEWTATDDGYAKIALLPATFPPRGWRRKPSSLLGRAGYYMMDLSAPILRETWQAALASANCALSAAQSVVEEKKHAFAVCRPPGHHAGRANCGGYCYINNASVAANWLSSHGKVAILDIDYHAGNGTQDIFFERGDVLTISIHADPDEEYPYYSGYADETGSGPGAGYHRNIPLPAGTDDSQYLNALEQALGIVHRFSPTSLVLSIGMDIYESDPLGKFKISRVGISEIGRRIARLGLPTTIVMEGGYNNEALGENVVAFLSQFI